MTTTKAYLDTSVLLRRLFKQEDAIQDWSKWQVILTSDLTEVEAFRTLDRLRITNKLADFEVAALAQRVWDVFKQISFLELDKKVFKRASLAFPTVVHTLDAIHLASALLLREQSRQDVVFLTHDRQLGYAAQASGLEVVGI